MRTTTNYLFRPARLAGPVIAGLLFLSLGGPVRAQESPESTNAPKTFASENEDRVRQALDEAVLYLRRLGREDEGGFIVPPVRQKHIVDWAEALVHYSEKEIDYPIYETYKTKTIVQTGESSLSSSRELQTVIRVRVKGYKKIKTLVPDANGKVTSMVRYPVYGPGGPDYLYPGFFGQNAMALYAMLQAGVRPEEEQFSRSYKRLLDYVVVYGMPDRTWDLAWLTILAVNVPRDTPDHKKLPARMVNKLLLGQGPFGSPAQGLWGPVCVNTKLLGKMVQYELDTNKRDVTSWEDRLKKRPDDASLKQKLYEARQTLKKFQIQYDDFSTIGLRFDYAMSQMKVVPDMDIQARVGWNFLDVDVEGIPYYMYGEQTYDMECTSLVLFALQEAARNKCLPETTTVPVTLENQQVILPDRTALIIQRSLEALVALQTSPQTKPFTETNIWMPVHDFDAIGGLPDLPVDDKQFTALDSPVTKLSAARSYSALLRAGLLAGPAAQANTLLPVLARGQKLVVSLAEANLKGDTNGPPMGGVMAPQEFLFDLPSVFTEPGEPLEANRPLWFRYADALLTQQNKNGSWLTAAELEGYETSLPPSYDLRYKRWYDAQQAQLPKDKKRTPYDPKLKYWRGNNTLTAGYYHSLKMRGDVAGTAYAMLFLAGGIREPAVGIWAWDGKPAPTKMVSYVIKALSREKKVPLTYRILPPELPFNLFRRVPTLYLVGAGPFAPAEPDAQSRLKIHLENDGLVLAEVPAGPEGQTFSTQLQAKLRELDPPAQPGALPPLVKGVNVQGLVVSNHVVAAIYPVSQANQLPAGAVRWSEAAQFTYQLLQQDTDARIFTTDYPINWPHIEQAEKQEAEAKLAKAAKDAEEAARKAAGLTNAPADSVTNAPPADAGAGTNEVPKTEKK